MFCSSSHMVQHGLENQSAGRCRSMSGDAFASLLRDMGTIKFYASDEAF